MFSRRDFIQSTAAMLAAGHARGLGNDADPERDVVETAAFKHSVCRWCYPKFTVDELARTARELGLDSVELLEPDEWAVARRHGLACAMGYAAVPDPKARLTAGWNRVE